VYPDFLCIGARKAGTTWLQANLERHSLVWLPPVKETHHLDHRTPWLVEQLFSQSNHLQKARRLVFDSLRRWPAERDTQSVAWALRYCLRRRTDTWYASLFPNIEGVTCGEVCPGYAGIPYERASQVARMMPDLKILYILRHPVERAWSSLANHFRSDGLGLIDRFSTDEIMKRHERPKNRRHTDYTRNLDTWLCHYPQDQLRVVFFEEIQRNSIEVLNSVLEFIGARKDDSVSRDEAAVIRNPGKSEKMPETIRQALAHSCLEEVRRLHARFANGFTEEWLRSTERWCRAPTVQQGAER
jgi:hypothetical protein